MSLISRIYSAQGKFEEAVAATKIQAERDPLIPLYLNEIGILLTQMRRYEEAETWYSRAASMEQGRVGNLFNRVNNAYKWKGYSVARDLLDGWPDGDFKKWGLISFETFAGRNYQEALDSLDSLQTDTFEVLSTYLEKNLSYALVYRLLDKPALKISHAESARQRLEDLVRKFPKDPKYRSALGLAYALLGQKEEAIREGKTAVEQYPVSKDALWGTSYINNLVDILIICEEYEEAIDHLEYLMSIPAGRNVSTVGLQSTSFYDSLRDHPRFKRLLEKYSE
jgi:tetratricopeptide (TPR) repeat protein